MCKLFCFQAYLKLKDEGDKRFMLQAVYEMYDLQPVPGLPQTEEDSDSLNRFVFIGEYYLFIMLTHGIKV
jgi:hypothetical protein